MDHSDYGTVKNNPGEAVALIKTMNDLDAMGIYKVDWRKSSKMFLDNAGTSHNNTAKSIAFKATMATHLGDRIQRKKSYTYFQCKNSAWFQFLVKYRRENTTYRGLVLFAVVQMPQCRCQMPVASCRLVQIAHSA